MWRTTLYRGTWYEWWVENTEQCGRGAKQYSKRQVQDSKVSPQLAVFSTSIQHSQLPFTCGILLEVSRCYSKRWVISVVARSTIRNSNPILSINFTIEEWRSRSCLRLEVVNFLERLLHNLVVTHSCRPRRREIIFKSGVGSGFPVVIRGYSLHEIRKYNHR